ncbi:MAG: hypothetical protein CM1200mP18_06820 [Gammaproteobacteria bacterium]|nr:MAG: hypothetical protein CM1200mP18_06820 [Gammaproteobacteria bacterium]
MPGLYRCYLGLFCVSSNNRFQEGKAAKENGLRMLISRVRGKGDVCGRAPFLNIGPPVEVPNGFRDIVPIKQGNEGHGAAAVIEEEVKEFTLFFL